jgi:membrane fusion protein, multidrug efflux system
MHEHPKRTCVALSIVALASALSGCGKGQQGPQQGPGAMPVTVVTLRAEPVKLVRELPGRTSAFLVAEVRPQVGGIVKARLFAEGSNVKAGEALYQLDDATYRADYGIAKAAVARAEATLEAARLRARRTGELVKTGVVSAQDNDNAIAALGEAEAELESSRAALTAAGVVLGYARITSPISGRVGKSAVTEGALVKAAQDEPLATVQQLDPVYIDVKQSSAELLQLKRELAAGTLEKHVSLPVAIVLEDGSRYPIDGTLEFSDVSVDPGTGSYLLRIKVPNPDRMLLPGMYVRALVGNGVRPQGILVPQQGIARDPHGNATALVVGKDDKVELRSVQVSRTIGDNWLVDGGLVPGDRVIVEGLQKVQPGMPVVATEAGSPGTQPAPEAPADSAPAAEKPAAAQQK